MNDTEEFVRSSVGKRYVRALDAQLDLIRTCDTAKGRRWNEMVALMVVGANEEARRVGPVFGFGDRRVMDGTTPRDFAEHGLRDALNRSSTYYLTAHMMDMLRHITSSASILTDPLYRHDLPEPAGFVWCERFTSFEGWEKRREFHRPFFDAFAWHAGTSGISLSFYAERDHTREYLLTAAKPGDEEEAEALRGTMDEAMPLHLVHMMVWPYGETWESIIDASWVGTNYPDAREGDGLRNAIRDLCAWVMGFWAIVQTPIGRLSGVAPMTDRKAEKRAKGYPLDGEVRVVYLRKTVNRDPDHEVEHGDVHWSHRWVVGGHWRWQPYSAEEGRPCPHCGKSGVIHRRIFIAPYVKGPEDLPLVVKDAVKVVKR